MFGKTQIYPNVKGNLNISLSKEGIQDILNKHNNLFENIPSHGDRVVKTTIKIEGNQLVIESFIANNYY